MKYVVLVVLATLTCFPVHAHEAGDWIIRTGWISVQPNEDSDAIDVAGIVTLPGVDVANESQLGLTGAYMINERFGVELLAATPFTHTLKVSGIGLKAGDAKQLPPTLSALYFPDLGAAKFQPYVGVGINATVFFEEDVNNELNLALDGIVGLPPGSVDADLSLDDSWGLAVQIGFDYMINDNLLLNGAVRWIDIDTEAKISTAVADVKFDVEIDPVVYSLSLGYRF